MDKLHVSKGNFGMWKKISINKRKGCTNQSSLYFVVCTSIFPLLVTSLVVLTFAYMHFFIWEAWP